MNRHLNELSAAPAGDCNDGNISYDEVTESSNESYTCSEAEGFYGENSTLTHDEYLSTEWKGTADKLTEPFSSVEFKWKIENFSKLPKEVDIFYDSPEFKSSGFSWGLRLYPNGISHYLSEGWIGIFLKSGPEILIFLELNFIVGIENVNGAKKYLNGLCNVNFNKNDVRGWKHFLERDELTQQSNEFFPTDTLTIWIWLQHETPEYLKPEIVPVTVGNIKIGGPWKKTSEHIGMAMLSDDLKELLFDKEDDFDIRIKVKGKVFKAHRLILKARSVLSLMLSLDKAKKNGSEIEILDCEAEAFSIFLLYLYSGKVEKLSDTNMLDLYYIADKYEKQDLKAECDTYIKCAMSVKTISDIIYVTRNQDDTELLKCALDYFRENVFEIIHTAGWKSFLLKEPKYGRKLYEKAIKFKKSLTAIKGK